MKAAALVLVLLGAGLAWALLGGVRWGSDRLARLDGVEPTSYEAGPSGGRPAARQAAPAEPAPTKARTEPPARVAPEPAGAAEAVPVPAPPTPEAVVAEAPAALPLAPTSPAAPAGPPALAETPLDPLAALAALSPELATPAPPSAPPIRRATDAADTADAAGPEDPATAAQDPETREVAGDDVNLRSGPSVGDDALRRLDAGDRVEVLGRSRDWLRVRAPDGEEGWVREDFLRAP